MDISGLRERDFDKPLTVTELNVYIKNLLESNRTLSAVSVTGEISNFTDHRSGHLYFSIKDSESQIKAVMFRSQRIRLKFDVSEGMKVTVRGSVSVYSQTGTVQIYVNSIEPDGVGALYLAYEQLKAKLGNEGLFDDSNKKSVPKYPSRIGVITSPTGAAVRDIINVTKRRYPLADIYLYPSLVQGEGAEENLIDGLDYFEKSKLVDVIIIGRGGGSIEDLWAFNSEKLARKIYSINIPIISAVGHETDFTICDFVSDMRAPTPSAAAEIAVPDIKELLVWLCDAEGRLSSLLMRSVERKRDKLSLISNNKLFKFPNSITEDRKNAVSALITDAEGAFKLRISEAKERLSMLAGKTHAMSPLSVLKRGYSICENGDKVITSAKSLNAGETVDLIFTDGSAVAKILETKSKREVKNEEKR